MPGQDRRAEVADLSRARRPSLVMEGPLTHLAKPWGHEPVTGEHGASPSQLFPTQRKRILIRAKYSDIDGQPSDADRLIGAGFKQTGC
jgi:hypothetical protein